MPFIPVYFCALIATITAHSHSHCHSHSHIHGHTHTTNTILGYTPNFTTFEDVSLGINAYTNESRKRMPLVASSFIELISKGIFIDKTLFIHDILEEFNYTVIISPNKWGKTVNLDMLKTFLTIQVHPNGTRILPISQTSNYRLFTEGEYHSNNFDIKLEKPLLISHGRYKRPIVDKYLGQYPVIYLSSGGISLSLDSHHAFTLRKIIAKAFHEHKYMLEIYNSIIQDPNVTADNKTRAENNKKTFSAYLENSKDPTLSLQHSIAFLGEELFVHFEKKVFILIDDYEEIFHIDITRKQIPNSMERFLNHSHFFTTIITRTTPELYHEYKLIQHYLRRQHYPYYGFTTNEMELLYEYYKIPTSEQAKIKYWYGGHRTPFEEVFNPWSICNYMNTRQLKAYWNDTRHRHRDYLSAIFESHDFQYAFGNLISGEVYHITSHSFSGGYSIHFDLSRNLYALSYLYHNGYLNRDILPIDYYNSVERKVFIFTYIVINYEINIRMQTIFASKLTKILDSSSYELLHKTSTMWEQFLLGQESTSYELEKQMEVCCKTLNDTRFINERNLFYAIIMSTVALDQFHFIHWKFAEEKTTELEIVLSAESTGVIIEVTKGPNQYSAVNEEHQYSAINRINKYLVKFQQYPRLHDWREIKFVFFHLISNETVQIFSTVHPIDVDKKPDDKMESSE